MMEEWRKRTFPVGIKEDSLQGELKDYPLTIYYPAIEDGSDATPDESHAPYPGIVFAHGYLATAKDYVHTGKKLGSHGYVAAFFSTNMAENVIELRSVFRKLLDDEAFGRELDEELPISTIRAIEAIAQNSEAITKTIDYLYMNTLGVIQTDKIGIVGHSLGGMTSLQAAAKDKRLKAAVVCSAVNLKISAKKMLGETGERIGEKMMGDSDFMKEIKIPIQFIYGTEDKLTPFEHGLSYYNMILDAPKEALAINNPVGLKDLLGLRAHSLGLAKSEPGDKYTLVVLKYVVNWFNFFLYKDRQSWTYLFGKDVKKDLKENVLSQLKMEIKPTKCYT